MATNGLLKMYALPEGSNQNSWMHDGSTCSLKSPLTRRTMSPPEGVFYPVVLHPQVMFVVTLVAYNSFLQLTRPINVI